MQTNPKERLKLVAGEPQPLAVLDRQPGETAMQAAQRRHGKPFANVCGVRFDFKPGATVLTAERVAELAAQNQRKREGK